MDKIVVPFIVCFILNCCTTDREEVTISDYSYAAHLVSEDKFNLLTEQIDNNIEYIFLNDSTGIRMAPTFRVSLSTDSIIYLNDEKLKLIDSKQFKIVDSIYVVLKYEDDESESTLFFNKEYGPILWRGNQYHGHRTYDRSMRRERQLIDIIRNDSIDFGGI